MNKQQGSTSRWPMVSVVTPSLNQGKYIEQTLLSVLGQDYPNCEYIVIDGGSNDNTCDIIRQYEDRIDFWVSEPDKGQSDAINKGLSRTEGEIVAWINSDDQYYSNDVFSKVVEFFRANPTVDACFGNNIYVDEKSKLLYMRKAFPCYSTGLLRAWNFIHQPTVFLRRRVIDEFALNRELHFIMDYEFWLRISKKYRFKYLDQLISASRWHSDCKTMGGGENFYAELRKVQLVAGKGLAASIIPPKYLSKIFYNIQRLYTLPYLWRLKGVERFSSITIGSWSKLLKIQVFGLKLGGYSLRKRD